MADQNAVYAALKKVMAGEGWIGSDSGDWGSLVPAWKSFCQDKLGISPEVPTSLGDAHPKLAALIQKHNVSAKPAKEDKKGTSKSDSAQKAPEPVVPNDNIKVPPVAPAGTVVNVVDNTVKVPPSDDDNGASFKVELGKKTER